MFSPPTFEAKYNSAIDAYVTILLNGHVRTLVKPDALAFEVNSGYTLEYNKAYKMCGLPQDFEGGWFYLVVSQGPRVCQRLPNPLVNFYPDDPATIKPSNFLSLPGVSVNVLELIDEVPSHGGEYILIDGLTDALCNSLNDVTEETDAPIFGQLPDGSWLQFDPRLKLEENTVLHPIPDGGGLVRSLTAEREYTAGLNRDLWVGTLTCTCCMSL